MLLTLLLTMSIVITHNTDDTYNNHNDGDIDNDHVENHIHNDSGNGNDWP